jgi:hypothetical protein
MEVSMSSDTTPRRHSFPGQRMLDPGHFVFWYPGGIIARYTQRVSKTLLIAPGRTFLVELLSAAKCSVPPVGLRASSLFLDQSRPTPWCIFPTLRGPLPCS